MLNENYGPRWKYFVKNVLIAFFILHKKIVTILIQLNAFFATANIFLLAVGRKHFFKLPAITLAVKCELIFFAFG